MPVRPGVNVDDNPMAGRPGMVLPGLTPVANTVPNAVAPSPAGAFSPQGFLDAYKNAYSQAQNANQQRYGDILKGYNQLATDQNAMGNSLMGQFKGAYDTANAASDKRFQDAYNSHSDFMNKQSQAMGDWNKQVTDNYAKMFSSAQAQNQARNNELVGLSQQRQQGIMKDFEGLGQQAASDIRQDWGARQANSAQDMASRGMAGTTIAPTMQAGLERQKQQDLARLNEQLRHEKIGTETGLSGDTLGIQSQAAQQANQANLGYANSQTQLGKSLGENLFAQQNQGGRDLLGLSERFNMGRTQEDKAYTNALGGLGERFMNNQGAIGQNRLNFMNARTDAYPDMAQYAHLAMAMGQGGYGVGAGGQGTIGTAGAPGMAGMAVQNQPGQTGAQGGYVRPGTPNPAAGTKDWSSYAGFGGWSPGDTVGNNGYSAPGQLGFGGVRGQAGQMPMPAQQPGMGMMQPFLGGGVAGGGYPMMGQWAIGGNRPWGPGNKEYDRTHGSYSDPSMQRMGRPAMQGAM